MAVLDSSALPHDPSLARGRSRGPSLLRCIAREPLLHFLVIGAVIFAIGEHQSPSDAAQHRIVVDAARLARLEENYARQFGQPPSRATLESLIARYVDDEILYREGLAIKIDSDDEVVRRRIVQKMQFLVQDLHAPVTPSMSSLETYYRAHAAHYFEPARIAFSHIYFSPDKDGDAGAQARASKLLASLSPDVTRAPELGDPYPDAYDFAAIGPSEAERLFGETPIAKAIFGARKGRWSGPFRSGYGWHLVYVNAVDPPHLPSFVQIRERVRADFIDDAQAAANRRAFAALRQRYTVVVEGAGP